MTSTFNENYLPGLGKSAAVVALVMGKIEEAADIARSTAPVVTGEYRDSIRTEMTFTDYRVVGKVIADSDHAMIVESKHGTLARALRSVAGG
jgi:hypothetical protein